MPYVVQYNPQGLGSRSDYETRGKSRYLEDISPKWRLMSDASKSPLEGHGKSGSVHAAILRELLPSYQAVYKTYNQ